MAKCPPSLQVVRRFFLLSSLPESKGAVLEFWEGKWWCEGEMGWQREAGVGCGRI
jgi:hypothetical protein